MSAMVRASREKRKERDDPAGDRQSDDDFPLITQCL